MTTFFPIVSQIWFEKEDSLKVTPRCSQYSSGPGNSCYLGIRMIIGWTQDDGATNVGPEDLIQTEEDIAKSLKKYSRAVTKDQLSHIFSLYPIASFQEELDNYEAGRHPKPPRYQSISFDFRE